ncbi:MAG TPA: acyltransferase domain-containing protein, partial [Blastocatellia bacterium]
NFELPSQDIPFRDLRLKIQTSLDSWPCAGEPVTAGVSSFGIGGTNCHFVLEEAPGRREPSSLSPLSETKLAQAELLLLSAHSPTALRSLAAKVALMLEEQQEISLRDLCYTASARRSHHQHRIALVCRAREEVIENLHAFARGESPPAVSAGCHTADRHQKIVFLFSGLGSRWAGMGRELMKREPVFMASLIECDRAIREYLDWSLIEGLTSDKDHPRANAASASQCVLFAIQVSVAALLRSWGIEPDGVMGYGWGDIAASHVAGGLSLDDAARILSHLPPRSRLRSIAPSVPVYSTDSVARGNDTKSEIKRRPTAAVSTLTTKLLDEGYSIFLEISPHPILLPAIDRAAGDAGREVAALGSLRREVERAALLEAAGKLYTLGRSVNWAKLYAGNASFVRLPTYPWQRERYWIDPDQPHQMLEAPAPQERASTSEERGTVLQDFVRQQVAKVLMLAPADVDLHQHFIKLGMDSLMALELQSSIESVLGVSVPVVELLEELTIGELANQLHEQLHGGAGPGCARDDIVDRESWELLRI